MITLNARIQGNWSPGDESKLPFGPDWSLISIYQVEIALWLPPEITSDPVIWGKYNGGGVSGRAQDGYKAREK